MEQVELNKPRPKTKVELTIKNDLKKNLKSKKNDLIKNDLEVDSEIVPHPPLKHILLV